MYAPTMGGDFRETVRRRGCLFCSVIFLSYGRGCICTWDNSSTQERDHID